MKSLHKGLLACLAMLALLVGSIAFAARAQAAEVTWKAVAVDDEFYKIYLSFNQGSKAEAILAANSQCKSFDEKCSTIVAAQSDQAIVGLYCSNGYDDGTYLAVAATSSEAFASAVIDAGWFDPANCVEVLRSTPFDIPGGEE